MAGAVQPDRDRAAWTDESEMLRQRIGDDEWDSPAGAHLMVAAAFASVERAAAVRSAAVAPRIALCVPEQWQRLFFKPAALRKRDDDELSFYSASDDDSAEISGAAADVAVLDVSAADDAADATSPLADDGAHEKPLQPPAAAPTAAPRAEPWKLAFEGSWRLEGHRPDYDDWLALKGINSFKRKVAASLPATKQFVMSECGRHVVHVYTLISMVELTQRWDMADADAWREECEAGLRCMISSSWGDGCLVIKKRFEELGLLEVVVNTLSDDGQRLIANMTTTVVSTGEARSTSDTFARIGPGAHGHEAGAGTAAHKVRPAPAAE